LLLRRTVVGRRRQQELVQKLQQLFLLLLQLLLFLLTGTALQSRRLLVASLNGLREWLEERVALLLLVALLLEGAVAVLNELQQALVELQFLGALGALFLVLCRCSVILLQPEFQNVGRVDGRRRGGPGRPVGNLLRLLLLLLLLLLDLSILLLLLLQQELQNGRSHGISALLLLLLHEQLENGRGIDRRGGCGGAIGFRR